MCDRNGDEYRAGGGSRRRIWHPASSRGPLVTAGSRSTGLRASQPRAIRKNPVQIGNRQSQALPTPSARSPSWKSSTLRMPAKSMSNIHRNSLKKVANWIVLSSASPRLLVSAKNRLRSCSLLRGTQRPMDFSRSGSAVSGMLGTLVSRARSLSTLCPLPAGCLQTDELFASRSARSEKTRRSSMTSPFEKRAKDTASFSRSMASCSESRTKPRNRCTNV
mmetsp:Transcript_48635/g.135614  ORF Transcript_48635/g.135614 Transcript_48635/m.135614 type:complete len:220 (-) Transcript_48635:847-1506(-)